MISIAQEELVDVKLLPHQQRTVRKVIDDLNGRAILADEVGLGKTIEAGMIIKEYINRGEIKKLLILVPASLAFQWTSEMVNKIKLDNIFFNRKGRCWDYFDYQIASLDMAKRENHAKLLRKINFDMVIVDEAHKLKNRKTKNWKFVNSLNKKYCLLLTATPIQNNLEELYNLISILYPDLYQDVNDFKKKYVADKYVIKNEDKLKEDLNQVMVRNYHAETNLQFSERKVKRIAVNLTDKERELYDCVTSYVREEYKRRKSNKLSILNLLTYQRELCSSPYALQCTLEKKKNRNNDLERILSLAKSIGLTGKIRAVTDLLKQWRKNQIIIFTKYRATQAYIAYHLEKRGYDTILFNGGFSTSGKEWIKHVFRKNKDVLISTEAGSQGLNFQFCNVIINYDLPWNPMKLEQRIGRVHRLGQEKNVYIYNLATKDTVEEKILKILYKKINLFKNIVGEMEDILTPESEKGLEADILKIIGETESEQEIEEKLTNLL